MIAINPNAPDEYKYETDYRNVKYLENILTQVYQKGATWLSGKPLRRCLNNTNN